MLRTITSLRMEHILKSQRYVLPMVAIGIAIFSGLLLGQGPLETSGLAGFVTFVIIALLWVFTVSCVFFTGMHGWGSKHVSALTEAFFKKGMRYASFATLVAGVLGGVVGWDRFQAGHNDKSLVEQAVLQRVTCAQMSGTGVRVTIQKAETKNGKWCFSPQGSLQSGLRDTIRLHPDRLGSIVPIGKTIDATLYWYPSDFFGRYGYFAVDTK